MELVEWCTLTVPVNDVPIVNISSLLLSKHCQKLFNYLSTPKSTHICARLTRITCITLLTCITSTICITSMIFITCILVLLVLFSSLLLLASLALFVKVYYVYYMYHVYYT